MNKLVINIDVNKIIFFLLDYLKKKYIHIYMYFIRACTCHINLLYLNHVYLVKRHI